MNDCTRCGCQPSNDLLVRSYNELIDRIEYVCHGQFHKEYLTRFGRVLHPPNNITPSVVCIKPYTEYRAVWLYGVLHQYKFTTNNGVIHHYSKPALMRLDGSFRWYWMGKEVTAEKHIEIRKRIVRQMRWLKTRRFLKLCKSKAFVETFYSPESMGGRWAKKQLSHVCQFS